MQFFVRGIVAGFLLGVIFGVLLSRIPEAVRAIGIGFGAGIGIFVLGVVVRWVGGLTDNTVSKIKEGKQV
jgi:xanthosine utilization system XapX-like protein